MAHFVLAHKQYTSCKKRVVCNWPQQANQSAGAWSLAMSLKADSGLRHRGVKLGRCESASQRPIDLAGTSGSKQVDAY